MADFWRDDAIARPVNRRPDTPGTQGRSDVGLVCYYLSGRNF